MTFGELIFSYFDELLTHDRLEYDAVDIKYLDIDKQTVLGEALQKAIYHDMFPNADVDLRPHRSATLSDMSILLNTHFGIPLTRSSSSLTRTQYEHLMDTIRNTYAYKLIQSHSSTFRHVSPEGYRITQVSNFPILDKVYSQLKAGHYDIDDISDEELIYGAAHGIARSFQDPFTSFLDPVDASSLDDDISGNYAGIGAYIEIDKQGFLTISGTLPGSPARAA